MTFQETLDFLYKQLPVFHRDGASAYKKDLSRTIQLLEHLGNPHTKFKSIHIAGTNGKGSTSHFLASILQEAGYKTGLYTSPHIKHFGERIKINGNFIEEEYVIRFVKDITQLLEVVKPSFFELTVALAYKYFAENKVDVAVIETGLGGRLDSTNVITPLLSLITNISYDHADLLGNTLAEIASEKAGIIKKRIPVVVSERQPEVEHVFIETAVRLSSEIEFASDFISVKKTGTKEHRIACAITDHGKKYDAQSELAGNYQLKNLGGVIAAVQKLNQAGFEISQEHLLAGLANVVKNTNFKGRWQVIHKNPLIICDIAHNEAGIKEVLETCNEYNPARLHIVLGMVKDKDIGGVLNLLPPEANYYFTQAHIPRAMPVSDLRLKALEKNISGKEFFNVNDAILDAKNNAAAEDLILVCGSNFLIAEVDLV